MSNPVLLSIVLILMMYWVIGSCPPTCNSHKVFTLFWLKTGPLLLHSLKGGLVKIIHICTYIYLGIILSVQLEVHIQNHFHFCLLVGCWTNFQAKRAGEAGTVFERIQLDFQYHDDPRFSLHWSLVLMKQQSLFDIIWHLNIHWNNKTMYNYREYHIWVQWFPLYLLILIIPNHPEPFGVLISAHANMIPPSCLRPEDSEVLGPFSKERQGFFEVGLLGFCCERLTEIIPRGWASKRWERC